MIEKSPLEIPFSEKLKGIPGFFGIRFGGDDLYEVECTEAEKEIRKYRPLILATITAYGTFEEAKKEAFSCLTGYIFGQNKDNKHLKMTAPVIQEETIDQSLLFQEAATNGWTMSFVLPPGYTLATAPTPVDKRIYLQKTPERLIAAYRYSGKNNQEKIRKYSVELMDWINKSDIYVPTGDIQFAQYDSTTTLSFLRRNEIHLEIKQI